MNALRNVYRNFILPLAELSPRCKTVCRLQSEALDRQLSFRQRTGVRVHLLLCKWCRRYGKQIRLLRQLARERGDEIHNAAPQELCSVFRPYGGEKIETPQPVQRDSFLRGIHDARFKPLPGGFRKLSAGNARKPGKIRTR